MSVAKSGLLSRYTGTVVDELEKESWFSAYLEMSDKDGKSMDFLGYQSIHHDKRFMKVFGDICNTIRQYLNTLNVDTTILDINITKTWFNVKTNSSNLSISSAFRPLTGKSLSSSGKRSLNWLLSVTSP